MVLSIGGAVIAFLATCLVGLLAFMGKFALQTVNARVDDAKARVAKLESDSVAMATSLATQKTQSEAESQRFSELGQRIASFEKKIDTLTTAVSELTGQLRHKEFR